MNTRRSLVRLAFVLLALVAVAICAPIACAPPAATDAPPVATAATRHVLGSNQGSLLYATPAIGAEAGAQVVASGNSGDLDTSRADAIQIDFTITALDIGDAGTGTFQLSWQRKGLDGNYYTVWASSSFAANAARQGGQSIGKFNVASFVAGDGGLTNTGLGGSGRLVWTLTGALSCSFSASVQST